MLRDIVGAFIFSADGKLLLGKGGVYGDDWLVPGGGIEEGESKLAAVKREVTEETGIDLAGAHIERIAGALTGESEKMLRDTGERVLVKMRFYNFRIDLPDVAQNITLKTEDDFTQAKWVALGDLSGLKLSPPSITTLRKMGYLP